MRENMFEKIKNILAYENLFGIIISIRNAMFPIER